MTMPRNGVPGGVSLLAHLIFYSVTYYVPRNAPRPVMALPQTGCNGGEGR